MGARLPAGTAQTGQENRPLSDGRFSVFSAEKALKPSSHRRPPQSEVYAQPFSPRINDYTRSMRVNNQPNLPLITAASQNGQMLVMSTLTDAPQLGHACEVTAPGLPASASDGR